MPNRGAIGAKSVPRIAGDVRQATPFCFPVETAQDPILTFAGGASPRVTLRPNPRPNRDPELIRAAPERPAGTVALDLDGTLTDARPRQLATLREAARDLRLACPAADAVWRCKREGLSTREALRALDVPDPEAAALAARWTERIEDDDLLALDRPLPAAESALGLISRTGAAPVVLTARRRAAAVRSQIARLFGDRIREVIVVAPGSVIGGKAAALRELAPVGYVGDTEADAEAAGRAGVPFAAVASGQRDPVWLRARTRCAVYPDALGAVRAVLRDRRDR